MTDDLLQFPEFSEKRKPLVKVTIETDMGTVEQYEVDVAMVVGWNYEQGDGPIRSYGHVYGDQQQRQNMFLKIIKAAAAHIQKHINNIAAETLPPGGPEMN